MSEDTFSRVLSLLASSEIPMAAFVGFGEPTLHKGLADMIRRVREARPEIVIKLTTNGSMLSQSKIEQLYDAGLDYLELSVMGGTPADYDRMMGGLHFVDASQAIDRLNAHGGLYGLSTFEYADISAHELRQFWLGHGARHVTVKELHHRGGYLAEHSEFTRTIARSSDYQEKGLDAVSAAAECHKLYMFLHVNADGHVVPCVQEINSKNIVSNVGDSGGYGRIFEKTRSLSPTFDICKGCVLRHQDLLDAYAKFFAENFSDRLETLSRRMAVLRTPTELAQSQS